MSWVSGRRSSPRFVISSLSVSKRAARQRAPPSARCLLRDRHRHRGVARPVPFARRRRDRQPHRAGRVGADHRLRSSSHAAPRPELRRPRGSPWGHSCSSSRPRFATGLSFGGDRRGTGGGGTGPAGPATDAPGVGRGGVSRRAGPAPGKRARSADDLRRGPPLRGGAADSGGGAAPSADRLQESRRLRLPGSPAPRRHPPRRATAGAIV